MTSHVSFHNHQRPHTEAWNKITQTWIFIKFLIKGFLDDFHSGFISLPLISFKCNYLHFAINDPQAVDSLLAKEVKEGFLIGLFSQPPVPKFCNSPIGMAARKYSGKNCIITHDHPSCSFFKKLSEHPLQFSKYIPSLLPSFRGDTNGQPSWQSHSCNVL